MTAADMGFVGCFPGSGSVHAINHILARTAPCQWNQVVMMVLIMIMVLLPSFVAKEKVVNRSVAGSILASFFQMNMNSFLIILDGLIDCEDSECCTDVSCSSSQMCATVVQPRDVLLKVIPTVNGNFYQVSLLSS